MTQADSVLSTPPTNTSALPLDPTRRHLLAIAAGGAVAAAIPTTVATAAAVDPIFAAIDEHRKAQSVHLAAIHELSRLERIHGDAAYGSITEKPCHDDSATFDFLVGTAATTVAGLFAKIDYLREIASRDVWMLDEPQCGASADRRPATWRLSRHSGAIRSQSALSRSAEAGSGVVVFVQRA